MKARITRRQMLRCGGLAGMAVVIGACQPKVVEKIVRETVPVKETVAVKETVTVKETVVVRQELMRKLKGRITVAAEGSVPVPGMPLTARQEAWQRVLRMYKQYQPNVEVILEDLPEGQRGEVWCEARKTAKRMPDISMVGECNYFRPSPEEVKSGANIAKDFMPFQDELNPYTGRPWREDWYSDWVRLGRGQQAGATDMWTCITQDYFAHVIWVNEDILAQYGYPAGQFPKTMSELWALSDKIKAGGKHTAWDNQRTVWQPFFRAVASVLTMKEFEAAGGVWNKGPAALAASVSELIGAADRAAPHIVAQFCSGTWAGSKSAAIREAVMQTKRATDAWGGSVFWDPARDQNGRLWLTGRAALRFASTPFVRNVQQAEKDGTLLTKNWRFVHWPKLTKDCLINKDLPIYFEGDLFQASYGAGDVFAPTDNVRASGPDANVDLIIRDFFQFLSSPLGQQRILDEGGIPLNPIVLQRADPRIAVALALRPKQYEGVNQPPGALVNPLQNWDTERSIEAYLRGDLTIDAALQKADLNATREGIKRMMDRAADFGITQPPDVCKAWQAANR